MRSMPILLRSLTSDLGPVGTGHLCPEAPAGEAERHVAGIGTARAVWGNADITAWGNRMFVCDKDQPWSIGDPVRPTP